MSHDMREGPKTLNMQSGSEERDYLLSIAWLVPARLTYCNTVECYERWRERWERDRGNAIGMQRRERVMLCGEDSGGESRK